jgi:hypothetical protein
LSEDTAHALGTAAAERQPTTGNISRRRLPHLSTSPPEQQLIWIQGSISFKYFLSGI